MNTLILILWCTLQVTSAFAETHDDPKVYLPSGYTSAREWPLVMELHGYAGNSFLIDTYFGLSAQVNRGFILVVPNGLIDSSGYRFWNASSGCCDFDHRNPADAAYLLGLVKALRLKYSIDAKRIFAVGHSNGAFMAHRLLCEPDSPFSSIVSFAGALPKDTSLCRPTHPGSVLQIHALDDDTIHFNGDAGYPKLAPYPSVEDTMNRWAAIDSCAGSNVKATRIDLTSSIPGPDASVTQWQNCRAGTRVEQWTIDAHSAWDHFPHTPFLGDEFTGRALDFLFGNRGTEKNETKRAPIF